MPTTETVIEDAFGGRIPVLRPELMSDEQKQVYDRINRGTVPWATKAGFRVKADGGGLLGPYNSQLLSPGTDAGYLGMLDAEKKHTSLKGRIREVIILSVGAVWKSDYEIYAHSAAARAAGLSDSAIQTLAAGGLPDDLDGQEKIAHRFARQLSLERQVDGDLYAEAERSFGLQGLADMIYLIGIYHLVCGFLNSFDVPVPDAASAGVRQGGPSAELSPRSEKPLSAIHPLRRNSRRSRRSRPTSSSRTWSCVRITLC